jgi:tellurite resistance protein TehA-like permease
VIVRTAAGVVAGAVAGAGSLLTLDVMTRYCNNGFGRTGCGASFPLTFGLSFAIWMVVAAGLVCAAFRVLRVERGWWAGGIGGGLWFVLVLAVMYIRFFHMRGMYQEDVHHVLETLYVTTACAAYAVAALAVGRARPC